MASVGDTLVTDCHSVDSLLEYLEGETYRKRIPYGMQNFEDVKWLIQVVIVEHIVYTITERFLARKICR